MKISEKKISYFNPALLLPRNDTSLLCHFLLQFAVGFRPGLHQILSDHPVQIVLLLKNLLPRNDTSLLCHFLLQFAVGFRPGLHQILSDHPVQIVLLLKNLLPRNDTSLLCHFLLQFAVGFRPGLHQILSDHPVQIVLLHVVLRVITQRLQEMGDIYLQREGLLTDTIDGRVHIIVVNIVVQLKTLVHTW